MFLRCSQLQDDVAFRGKSILGPACRYPQHTLSGYVLSPLWAMFPMSLTLEPEPLYFLSTFPEAPWSSTDSSTSFDLFPYLGLWSDVSRKMVILGVKSFAEVIKNWLGRTLIQNDRCPLGNMRLADRETSDRSTELAKGTWGGRMARGRQEWWFRRIYTCWCLDFDFQSIQ